MLKVYSGGSLGGGTVGSGWSGRCRGQREWHLLVLLRQENKLKLKLVRDLESWRSVKFQNCGHLSTIGVGELSVGLQRP